MDSFDWQYYLDKYPDLRANGVKTEQQAITHWKTYGEKEGRVSIRTPALFDWQYYLDNYPDLRANGVNNEQKALQHWYNHGEKEGRVSIRTPNLFDWQYYLDKYPDLRANGVDNEHKAIQHWYNHGEKEGRISYLLNDYIVNTLCIVSIFKNESHILKEWIDHYLKEGVDIIYLIDNGSTDNYMYILDKYINEGKVVLNIDSTKHQQVNLINKYYLNIIKKYEWAMIVDLDEFVYARNGYTNIKDYLITLDSSISQVFIPWKMFGSNGFNTLDKLQPESVIKSFTKRTNYCISNDIKFSLTKCIVKTVYLKKLEIHSHFTINNNYITSDNTENNIHINKVFSIIDEQILINSNLHLNHYAIQSLDWFMRVKATRGAADSINSENIRNEVYFNSYDSGSNDIFDYELSTKKY